MKKVLLLLALLVTPLGIEGATFRVESETASYAVGDEFLVTILVDSEGESINAFEGRVVFPEELVEFKGIREQGSIVNLWITEPPHFSGLTPGGYRGQGVLFSLIFQAKAQGAGSIGIEEGRVLLNDGQATPAALEISHFPFSVEEPEGRAISQVSIEDTEAPEPFELRIARDSSVFGGRAFLVFATQDKNSGVSHYEVSLIKSGAATDWVRAKSPFLLEDFEELRRIEVRAVDRAGNERIATLLVSRGLSIEQFLLFGNLVILVGIGSLLGFWLWRRRFSF